MEDRINFYVGSVPIIEGEILYANTLDSLLSLNDIGKKVIVTGGFIFEIVDVGGVIVALLPLNEIAYQSVVQFPQTIPMYFSGKLYDFSFRGSNKSRRLIEDGETHKEFEKRKDRNKYYKPIEFFHIIDANGEWHIYFNNNIY